MNERIKELYAKALNKAGDEAMRRWANAAVVEKFAELIVKECARAIINDRRLNDVRSAANGCVRTINEHFGVK